MLTPGWVIIAAEADDNGVGRPWRAVRPDLEASKD
jgi:hypothetical protein